MTLIMDGLLLAAAAFAGTYCFVLSRRVQALKDLDSGLGAAIVRMTRTLEEARRALEDAKAANSDGHKELKELITRADSASGQLRILLAATRDLPSGPAPRKRSEPDAAPRPVPSTVARTSPPLAAPSAVATPLANVLIRPAESGATNDAPPIAPALPARTEKEHDLIAALAEFATTSER